MAPLLNTMAKFGTKSPDCGTRTGTDCERWLLFPTGLWLVAGISYSFWMGAWMVALMSWRLRGTLAVRMPGALKGTPRTQASDLPIPRHNFAHFCCAKCCHSKVRLFLIPPPPVQDPSQLNTPLDSQVVPLRLHQMGMTAPAEARTHAVDAPPAPSNPQAVLGNARGVGIEAVRPHPRGQRALGCGRSGVLRCGVREAPQTFGGGGGAPTKSCTTEENSSQEAAPWQCVGWSVPLTSPVPVRMRPESSPVNVYPVIRWRTALPPPPSPGAYVKGGGGGGWTQKPVYQKWPGQTFPIANFVVSHGGPSGGG